MGNMVLWVDNFENDPLSLPCYHIDFADLHKYTSLSGYDKHDANQHMPTLEEPWLTHCFSCKANFTVDDIKHKVVEERSLPAAFLPKFQYQIAPASQGNLQPKLGTYVTIAEKPSDWDNICLKRIALRKISDGLLKLSRYTDWNELVAYAGSTYEILCFDYPIAMTFLVHDGIRSFSFGISNLPNYQLSVADNRNFLCSGMVVSPTKMAGVSYSIGWAASNLTDEQKSVCFTDLSNGHYLIQEVTLASGELPSAGQDTSITRCQSYPCEYVIPKGTNFPGKGTVTKDWQMYGVMSVSFNQYGEAVGVIVQALSYNLWSIRQGSSGNSAGPDTNSRGGHGKQKNGTDNPYNPITRNKSGGILTDPTASPGFCIYKFTPANFTKFLNAVYTKTSLPTVSTVLSELTLQSEIGNNFNVTLPGGWSNTENIVFVKTSPVSFASHTASLSEMSIGALGIPVVDFTCDVVEEYIKEDHAYINEFGDTAQWFTDVEPYASASIYFPLAGSIAIPPSMLEGATGDVYYAFNLLNNGCGYSLQIDKDGSWINYAKNGECAKSADCVIPGRDISGTVGAVGALAATGIATIATGGTALPALLTTAAGAATTAVHDAVDISVSNLPPSSSGSPYDDTVNGGLRDIFLYRPKAKRFTSGESSNDSERAEVIGTFSYKYVSTLSDAIPNGNFFNVIDVKLDMANGMTKAEHDKIVALLKEGVYM